MLIFDKYQLDGLSRIPEVILLSSGKFYETKDREISLGIDLWTGKGFRKNLLCFWRIKKIREKFLREYGIDIRPTKVLVFPRGEYSRMGRTKKGGVKHGREKDTQKG